VEQPEIPINDSLLALQGISNGFDISQYVIVPNRAPSCGGGKLNNAEDDRFAVEEEFNCNALT